MRVKSDPVTASDAELIRDVRSGDSDAYAVLYERHAPAAHRYARRLARNPHAADDALADAFAKILAAIKHGTGPRTSFRPYLFTAVRTTVIRGTRWRNRVDLTDPAGWDLSDEEPASDPTERALILQAFSTLPERSRAVLWHLEAEGLSPAEVAPILGLTANGVSALAYRSRESLRRAYLHAHVARPLPGSCRKVADLLPAKVRDDLTTRQRQLVDDHLDDCARCRDAVHELDDVAAAFRTVVGPLVGGGSLWLLLRRTTGSAVSLTPKKVAAVAAIAAVSVGSGQLLLHVESPIRKADAMTADAGGTHGSGGAAGSIDVGGGVPISRRVPLAHRQAAAGGRGAGARVGGVANRAPGGGTSGSARTNRGIEYKTAAPGTDAGPAADAGGVRVQANVPGVLGTDVGVGVRGSNGPVTADATIHTNVAGAADVNADVHANVDLAQPNVDADATVQADVAGAAKVAADTHVGVDLAQPNVDADATVQTDVAGAAKVDADAHAGLDLSKADVDAKVGVTVPGVADVNTAVATKPTLDAVAATTKPVTSTVSTVTGLLRAP